jgi:hypothetical protein
MRLTKELKELVSKWKKILKLEDWDLEILLECPKKYKEIEITVGLSSGASRALNISTEERQHSLIVLNTIEANRYEQYLVHELNHSILNEMIEFVSYLINMTENEEVKSVLENRRDEILEKLVWKYTRITLELDRRMI